MRKIIDDLGAGRPDYAMMRPYVAGVIRSQVIQLQTTITEQGQIQSVSFRGVGPAGPDVYEIQGEKGTLECQMWLAPDGKLAGWSYRRRLR